MSQVVAHLGHFRLSVPASISPVQNFIQCLIGVFITLDPLHEIFYCFLCVTVGVVGAAQLHLLYREKAEESTQAVCFIFSRDKINRQTQPLTTMFSWMTSGSSHTDSTKNTWDNKGKENKSALVWKSTHVLPDPRTVISHLKAVLLSKLDDGFPSFSGGVCCIKNLYNTGHYIRQYKSRLFNIAPCIQPAANIWWWGNEHLTYCNLALFFCEVLSHIVQRCWSTLSVKMNDNVCHKCHMVAD